MTVILAGDDRQRFRRDLAARRAGAPVADQEFARDRLRVSLNTLEKCLAADDEPLALSGQTFASICAGAALIPQDYGIDAATPAAPDARYGGYGKAEFGFLAGRYALYRRSFLTGRNVNRSLLEIVWSEAQACLVFTETLIYVSDSGVRQTYEYRGALYMHRERALIGLLAADAGELRLILVHTPDRPVAGRVRQPHKLRGALLTHAYPKGFFQPTTSPVYIEELAAAERASPAAVCRTLTAGDPDHARIIAELARIETTSVIDASLVARGADAPA